MNAYVEGGHEYFDDVWVEASVLVDGGCQFGFYLEEKFTYVWSSQRNFVLKSWGWKGGVGMYRGCCVAFKVSCPKSITLVSCDGCDVWS